MEPGVTPQPEPLAHAAPVQLSRREKTLALAGTLTALLMAGLDQTIVATAGPEIQRDLQIPASLYAWITTAYLVASTVMLPIYGKLSDVYGRKPVLMTGVVLFLLGSLLCGLAPTTGFLIAARVVQGLGAASLFTTTLAVIADLFPPAERGKYMGLIGGIMGISSVVGPLAGGVITDLLGWHWVFFINLPVGAVALWLIASKMPRLGGRDDGGRPRVDVAGAVWLVVGVVPLLVVLSLAGGEAGPGEAAGLSRAAMLAMLAVSAAGVALFVRTERRVPEPILDFAIFRNRTVALATLTMFVLGATFLFSVIFLPLYLVNVVGISATRAGLSLMPLTLAMVVTSIGAGQWVSRVGHMKAVLAGSLVLTIVAFGVMGFTLSPTDTQTSVTLKMVLVGLGLGPTLPLYTLVVQNAARPQDLGIVTAASTFSRALGQVLGITLFGALFALSLGAGLATQGGRVLAGLSPGARALVAEAAPMIGGGRGGLEFDAIEAERRILRSAEIGAGVAGAAQAAPVPGVAVPGGERAVPATPAVAGTAAERDEAIAALAALRTAFNASLTDAVRTLYRVGMALLLVALTMTLLTPGVETRRRR
jgi:EmrB/QacA subfamily drug resistance transporter